MDTVYWNSGRRSCLYLLISCAACLTSCSKAQFHSRSKPPFPAQLILRNASHSPAQNAAAMPLNSDLLISTLPPTELRIVYPPDSPGVSQAQAFPNKIRFSQSQLPQADAATPITNSTSSALTAQFRAGPDSFREIDQYVSDRTRDVPANVQTRTRSVGGRQAEAVTTSLGFAQSLINQSYESGEVPPQQITRMVNGTTSSVGTRALVRDYDTHERLSSDSSGGKVAVRPVADGNVTSSSFADGPISVGAIIGIIAGILTALVLTAFAGLLCYRRRHPTWNAAETDLRVLAAHYGSYWDDKTLPNYQFNDRIIWPGETQEEMIALDNDAFLKSLEDLGRVNSRPSSKTNWNTEEDQRQSTKV